MQKLDISSSSGVINNISCVCGHCKNIVSLKVYARYYIPNTSNNLYYTGQCPFCGRPIIFDNIEKIAIPYSSCFESINHLPTDIESLFNECKSAFSVGAYTCCVISARTLMANIAVEQGDSAGKSFVEYVNYLQTNCLPSRTNNSWVDKIRQLGNESTHKLVIADKESAELAIKFIIAILKNVYEFPNSI